MLPREPKAEHDPALQRVPEFALGGEGAPHPVQELLLFPQDQGQHQVVLRREIPVDRLARKPGGSGHILDRGPGQADVRHAAERRVEDARRGIGGGDGRGPEGHDVTI